MSVIKTESLTKIYMQGQDEVHAVDNVSLSIEPGEFTAITGQSGSGKTTLLNLLGGIETPTSGCVYIDGVNLQKVAEPKLAQIKRQKIGHIFQDFKLIPILSAQENIAMPMLLDGKKASQDEIERLASFLGIENRLKHFPSELSGGQKQRVAIARALAMQPEVLLFDEPTSALDPQMVGEVLDVMRRLAEEGLTMIVVTHEMAFARDVSTDVVYMSDGVICEQGKPHELFENPQNPKTREFLSRFLAR